LFGIQNEESPRYSILKKEGDFEIRRYEPYIVAKVTMRGNANDDTGDAFRVLAGYIFGKNKGNAKIAMTAPVEMKQEPVKIAMTTPVEMTQNQDQFTMTFSMPSKYNLENLPEPEDKRIQFEEIPSRIIASHQFSWLRSDKRNQRKAQELREWLKSQDTYRAQEGFSYAGYNPPWTIPFFRRNEIHIELQQ
jgi:hypothetical protein